MMEEINLSKAIYDLAMSTGLVNLTLQQVIMFLISFLLIYLAIVKKFEPLLLLPIGFGMLLANIPNAGLMTAPEITIDPLTGEPNIAPGGLLYYLYQGVKLGIYPPLIFWV